jgi:hypothetical protein
MRCAITAAALLASSCHDVIDDVPATIEAVPERLFDTGLYADLASDRWRDVVDRAVSPARRRSQLF